MEELLGALLYAFAEMICEVILQFLGEMALAYLARGVLKMFGSIYRMGPFFAFAIFALLGAAFGELSVLALPHPVFHPSRFHGISLLISPFVTGLIMSWLGRGRRRHGRIPMRIESFGYGFTFALAMALVRFALVK
jgi:hypothetical protein